MTDLAVIVPSRGRPQNADRLWTAFEGCPLAELVLCCDNDDPTLPLYRECEVGPPARLVAWLNRAAADVLSDPDVRYVGFMGDDHLPRTPDWDAIVCDTLAELGTGIVYGNDLLQGERLPTAAFMTRDIVEALGYMAPPELEHLYVDDAWLAWGRAIGRIRYLPDLIIEHVHPAAGKAPSDAGYETADACMTADAAAFGTYLAERFDADVAKLRALL